MPTPTIKPLVFLSHAGEDNTLAKRMAETFFASSIETWYDQWEIRTGDSLRRKIEAGIEGCTHFVVLLTTASVNKPWVNEEIDGGLVQMIEGKSKFMPVRFRIGIDHLSLFIKTKRIHQIEEESFDENMSVLIEHIFEVTNRPPLGAPRFAVQAEEAEQPNLSVAATMIAKLMVEESEHASLQDPYYEMNSLKLRLGLSAETLEDAVDELERDGSVSIRRVIGEAGVGARPELFACYDQYWQQWNPADDAVQVAQCLMEGKGDEYQGINIELTADRLGWSARRMNPALEYLAMHDAALFGQEAAYPWRDYHVIRTANTRRFVQAKSR